MRRWMIKHYNLVELLLVPAVEEIRKGSMEEFLEDVAKELLLVPPVDEIRKGSVEEVFVENVYDGSGSDGVSSLSST